MPPILSIKEAHLQFGDKVLLKDTDFFLYPQDKISLIGQNGSGKTTFLKSLARIHEIESGEFFIQPGTTIGYLEQRQSFEEDITATQYLEENMDDLSQIHLVKASLDEFGIPSEQKINIMSGGEKKRLALSLLFLNKPEIAMLDEPTNHLDIAWISILEEKVKKYNGSMLIISHDRRFLENCSNKTLWIHNHKLHPFDRGFKFFEEMQEKIFEQARLEQKKQADKLKQERGWLNKGVTARRKRNQRRLKEFIELRKAVESQQKIDDSYEINIQQKAPSKKKLLINARNITKSYGDKKLVPSFTRRFVREEKIGIVGPNGCGKTTFLKLLTKEIEPDQGEVKHGTSLSIGYIKQEVDEKTMNGTVKELFCPGGGDLITVQGVTRNIFSYLKDFQFDSDHIFSPLRCLSGGERQRIFLAELFTKTYDLIILDEPTNDLDLDTLEALQEILFEFKGTLILVSHDRDFLNRSVNSLFVFNDQTLHEHRFDFERIFEKIKKQAIQDSSLDKPKIKQVQKSKQKSAPKKLSFKENYDLENLPQEIEKLENEIAKIEDKLADPNLYQSDPDLFHQASEKHQKLKAEKDEKENRWLELDLKREMLDS